MPPCNATGGTNPALFDLVVALLARAGEAHERTAAEARTALEDMALGAAVGPAPVVAAILGGASGGGGSGSGGAKKSRSSGNKWRPVLARLLLLATLVGKFGLAPDSGLTLKPVMDLAVPALSNAAVKVRCSVSLLLVLLLLLLLLRACH